jgi:hypothetical protein
LIEASFDAWLTACGNDFGPACFTGNRIKLWQAFLQAIIDHGGWTNDNDDQVKLEAGRRNRDDRRRRNDAERKRRERERLARRGTPLKITAAYRQALRAERDKRADGIKRLGTLSGRTPRDMLWLKLPDTTCERIADVWSTRELLSCAGQKVTGRAIAEHMMRDGRSYGLKLASLIARVHDDLRRIARFEDSRAGAPIWSSWVYSDDAKP